ncbi:MAG: translational GTPase TypA [Candidatus Aminicenantes bacterium]|nr:translational GTPase TypA [Candidatus Aminicenantes bacterium]
MKKLKNIAIIAHVDHGKTTLIDAALRQTGAFRDNQKVAERIMDSNDIERERGITIFSKNAALFYKDYKINIVDTPGHADFGGEVQRIMKMVDAVLLLVDAFEGPMPQTKYVLKKSLEQGLNPIVVINKIDRPNARPHEVLNAIFDLFVELNANESQLEFPVIYASAKYGVARYEIEDANNDLIPLFDTILKHVKEPGGDPGNPMQFLTSAISYDNYLGKMGTGKIHNGVVKQGQEVVIIKQSGEQKPYKITKLFTYTGLKKESVPSAAAGDIVSIAGIDIIDVGDTIAAREFPVALPTIFIDEPTLAITFVVNDSPFAGNDGKYVTSRHVWDRLQNELRTNVSMRVEETDKKGVYKVKARGALQLSILIENMRRENYEFQVSKPEVIYREIDDVKCEPMELAIIDVAEEYAGVVIEMFGIRKGELINMTNGSGGYTRLEFIIPSRSLIGFRNDFLTATHGSGIINHSFHGYEPFKGESTRKTKGVLVALEPGVSVAYGIFNLQERGSFFIGSGVPVYAGMIVGEHSKDNDLVVNVCKTKKLTNMRAAGSDDAVRLTPPRQFSIEQALEYIEDDELLEVTPQSLRMRKKYLDIHLRKRADKLRKVS